MAITTKFELFDVVKFMDEFAGSPQEQSKAFAKFARDEITEADNQNAKAYGRQIPHVEYVDGIEGSSLQNVWPNSTVVAEWQFGEEIVDWVFRALKERSPVLTGRFRNSISIFADDVMVKTPAEARGAEHVVIMSTVPYARKLEGLAGEKYMSSKKPGPIFQAVAAVAKRKFGNQARIAYTFRGPSGANTMIEAWASGKAGKHRLTKKSKRQYDKDVRNPAVLIMFK